MKRISYLIALLFVSLGAQAQLTTMPGDTAMCAGSTIEFVASGVDSVFWSSTGGTLSAASGDTVTFTTTAPNTYTITAIGYFNNDPDTIEHLVVVNGLPTVVISSSAASQNNFVCLGSSATLTASASTGVVSYLWTPAATLDNDTSAVVVASPTAQTSYAVTVTDTNGCTKSATQVLFVQISAPTISMNAADTVLCPGESTTITAGTALQYVWSGPAGTIENTSAAAAVVTPMTTSTYNVTLTTNGCSSTGSVEITVLDAPAISNTQSSNGNAICLDETDVITVTCAECVSYIWYLPGATVQTSVAIQSVSPNTVGANTINIFGIGNNGCKANTVAVVNVDSCYIGTPWGVDEQTKSAIEINSRGSLVEIHANAPLTRVVIYNLLGEAVAELPAQNRNAVRWTPESLAGGVYIVRASTADRETTQKVYLQ